MSMLHLRHQEVFLVWQFASVRHAGFIVLQLTRCSCCFRFSLSCAQMLLPGARYSCCFCGAPCSSQSLRPCSICTLGSHQVPCSSSCALLESRPSSWRLRRARHLCSVVSVCSDSHGFVSGVAGAPSSGRAFPQSSTWYLILHVLVLLTPCPLQRWTSMPRSQVRTTPVPPKQGSRSWSP